MTYSGQLEDRFLAHAELSNLATTVPSLHDTMENIASKKHISSPPSSSQMPRDSAIDGLVDDVE